MVKLVSLCHYKPFCRFLGPPPITSLLKSYIKIFPLYIILMRSVSFRKDAVHFVHESDHSNGDVKFHTSNNFDMKKPIKCSTYVTNDTFKSLKMVGH